jgi:uncharacterized protein
MSERTHYPAGVPCWVETLQPDPRAAIEFYAPLFGWDVAGPGPMPTGEYFVARLRHRDVAGIGSLPDPSQSAPATWSTFIRVDRADQSAEQATRAGGQLMVAPFDVLPAGRMAVVVDPTGAVVCLWEAAARQGAQLLNEPGAWAMSMLHTTDPDRANAFYAAVFGWQAEPLDAPGAGVTLYRLPGYVGGELQQPVPRDVVGVMLPIGDEASPFGDQSHWSVDFWVADADTTAADAARLGGTVSVPPHATPGFRNAVLADPRRAVFSVSQLVC